MPYSLAESPTGLVHYIQLYGTPTRGTTRCGREVNWDTWTRITLLDSWMFGKGIRAIQSKIELPTCDRCFS